MAKAPSRQGSWRRAAFAFLLAIAAGLGGAALSANNAMDGFLYDLAIAGRVSLLPAPLPARGVAVIALDRRSLESNEIVTLPRALMAPLWAETLSGVYAAGARAAAFDIIFAYSANRLIANYDQALLRTLAETRGKTILARSLWTLPAKPLLFASGADRNPNHMGLVELTPDADGVFRRVQRDIAQVDGASLGLAAAAFEAATQQPFPSEILLAPPERLELYVPTYSLIDVLRCARQGPQHLAAAVKDRILFVGTTLPEEDRKEMPDRFLARDLTPSPMLETQCPPHPVGYSAAESRTNPGIYVHAAATEIALRGPVMREVPRGVRILLMVALAFLGYLVAFFLQARWAAAVLIFGLLAFCSLVFLLFLQEVWLPPFGPLLAFGGAGILSYVLRFVQEMQRRKAIQKAFGHYLPRSIVDEIAGGAKDLRLGGETREVTIMFADLSGFTKLSTQLPPERLMQVTNEYLALIVEAVESTGGYVDKFIGDAVMAMWNAPLDVKDHPAAAARAALMARDRVMAKKAEDEAAGQTGYAIKIGVNTGLAIVGNVGTAQRLNYTVVGEAVNVAARLESVPKDYECDIIVGQETLERARDSLLFCVLDAVRVVGREAPVAVAMPLIAAEDGGAHDLAAIARYGEALAAYRAQHFHEAERLWRKLLSDLEAEDRAHAAEGLRGPCGVMAARAAAYAVSPPPAGWDGVFTKKGK